MRTLERQIIYLLVIIIVSIPIIFKSSIPPAEMASGTKFFNLVESIEVKDDRIAFVALDFTPSTKAENVPQASVVIEHLLRRRVPFALMTLSPTGEGFLRTIPETVINKLRQEDPTTIYEYGVDWVNLGFRPQAQLFIQNLAKTKDLKSELKRDAFGTPLKDIPAFKNIKTLNQVNLLAEFTGLVGMFDVYVQFFQKDGYIPKFVHGCTSITVPEAYIYLDSGQLKGLLEGLAGAVWYSHLLSKKYENRGIDEVMVTNTALGIAHLVIIFLIILGNFKELWMAYRSRFNPAVNGGVK